MTYTYFRACGRVKTPSVKERFLKEERGFTLTEMMVTIMIMIVVFFALYSIFDMSLRVFSFGNNKVEAVENARLGLEKMEREIRAAIQSTADASILRPTVRSTPRRFCLGPQTPSAMRSVRAVKRDDRVLHPLRVHNLQADRRDDPSNAVVHRLSVSTFVQDAIRPTQALSWQFRGGERSCSRRAKHHLPQATALRLPPPKRR